MRRLLKKSRWVLAGATLLAFSGCVTNQQLFDFARSEFARAVADTFGRVFQLVAQGTA